MDCRKCGACCIAPSIATPIPNMPHGKPAGARCANLNDRNECTLHGKAARPAFCIGWQPMPEVCGRGFQEAMTRITRLEQATTGEGSRSLCG
jgi:Fe-S-cluster containining protein